MYGNNTIKKNQIKIFYILSVGHSGSTILDISLSTYPKSIGIGELFTFIKRLSKKKIDLKKHQCACGRRVVDCNIWNNILKKISKGKIKKYNHFYEHILKISNKEYIIDSSKELPPLTHLHNLKEKIILIVLIRDPVGSVWGYYKKYGKLFRFILLWIIYNIKIEIWSRRFPNKYYILYSDFVLHHNYFLRRLYNKVGEHYDVSYISSLNKKSHQIEGNGKVRLGKLNKIEFKTDWKKKMRLSHKIIVWVFTFPLYLYFRIKIAYLIKHK